ncbi:unnamed protein product [Phyllotreta striolata]|uniref:Ribosomal protein eL8/eL30/eS12/Gadd45 domain-containing protein n=1 Tax=Phyllotreta striolata TaxID=444603 RepID=A0A9N9TJQ5_PHYSR|nr:unnamed protein product [Phyllotreta striolata]
MGKTSEVEAETTIKEEPIDELSHEEKVANCNQISKPMASKKLAKKCYKLIKKAVKQKSYTRCGLKDVQKRLRKGETGIVVFAGDIWPIDIMCHLPVVCEDRDIPYVYVPSRKDLGGALGVKRGCLTVLIRPHNEYKEYYDDLHEEIKHLAVPL